MEYLVEMTTRVPSEAPEVAVAAMGAREAGIAPIPSTVCDPCRCTCGVRTTSRRSGRIPGKHADGSTATASSSSPASCCGSLEFAASRDCGGDALGQGELRTHLRSLPLVGWLTITEQMTRNPNDPTLDNAPRSTT